jgi:hypothetical protein
MLYSVMSNAACQAFVLETNAQLYAVLLENPHTQCTLCDTCAGNNSATNASPKTNFWANAFDRHQRKIGRFLVGYPYPDDPGRKQNYTVKG